MGNMINPSRKIGPSPRDIQNAFNMMGQGVMQIGEGIEDYQQSKALGEEAASYKDLFPSDEEITNTEWMKDPESLKLFNAYQEGLVDVGTELFGDLKPRGMTYSLDGKTNQNQLKYSLSRQPTPEDRSTPTAANTLPQGQNLLAQAPQDTATDAQTVQPEVPVGSAQIDEAQYSLDPKGEGLNALRETRAGVALPMESSAIRPTDTASVQKRAMEIKRVLEDKLPERVARRLFAGAEAAGMRGNHKMAADFFHRGLKALDDRFELNLKREVLKAKEIKDDIYKQDKLRTQVKSDMFNLINVHRQTPGAPARPLSYFGDQAAQMNGIAAEEARTLFPEIYSGVEGAGAPMAAPQAPTAQPGTNALRQPAPTGQPEMLIEGGKSNTSADDRLEYRAEEDRNKFVERSVNALNSDPVVKKATAMRESADQVLGYIDMASENPIAAEAIKTFMTRVSGEVGALSEADKRPFGGSVALDAKVKQAMKRAIDGTLTDENKAFVRQLAEKIMEKTEATRQARMREFAKSRSLIRKKRDVTEQELLDAMGGTAEVTGTGGSGAKGDPVRSAIQEAIRKATEVKK